MEGKAPEEDLEYNGRMRDEEEIRMSEILQEHLIRYGHYPSDADSDPFWHYCRTVFTTRFSLRQLKNKILSFYRQQQELLQRCAPEAPAAQTVEPQVNECGGATEQVGGPFSRFCRTHFPSRFSLRELKKKLLSFHQQLKWQAISTASEENESPAPSGSEDLATPPREKQASPPEQDDLDLAVTENMGNACSQNNPLSQQRPVVGDTIELDNNSGSRGDSEATNLQEALILPKESNHLLATKCHSNTRVKAIATVDILNLDHECLSIDNDASLELRQFPTTIDTENKSSKEADFEDNHLQLHLSLPTKDIHLPKHQSDAKERPFVAVGNSKPQDPLWSIGNDSPLQAWQALTRVEVTQLDNSSVIQKSIDFPMEQPATNKAKCDTLYKSNHHSFKQATASKASVFIDDNFQAVRAPSGPVFANNVDTEEDGGGAYGHGQDANSLHHVATIHGALSILQHPDNRRKRRFADAQGVDARHRIKMLRQSAILDLAQTTVTLSQINN